MTLKRYLLTMAFTTVICWGCFSVVLFKIDPNQGGFIGMALFFVALFFALWGTISLLGFFIRLLFKRNTVPFRHIGISLRQALWFAILITLTLFLVYQELLVWWMALFLVVGLTVLEGFFLARSLESRLQSKKHNHRNIHERTN